MRLTKNQTIRLLEAGKYFFGTVGAMGVIADYKWIGLAIMVTATFCDAALKFLKPETK